MLTRVFIILYCALTWFSFALRAEEVEALKVRGVLERSSRFNTGYSASIDVILTQDGRFFYTYDSHQNYPQSKVTYSFDGISYYYLIDDKDIHSDSLASITSKGFPYPGIQDEIRDTLWIVLSAANQYDGQKDNQEFVYLYEQPRSSFLAFGYGAKINITESRFPMVSEINIFRDSSYDLDSFKENKNRREIDRELTKSNSLWKEELDYIQSIPDGVSVMDILWDEEEIVSGMLLPKVVTVNLYYAVKGGFATTEIIRINFDKWETRNIQADHLFRPEITKPTIVLDARVRNHDVDSPIDEVGYHLGKDENDLNWLPVTDEKIQAALKRRIERKHLSKGRWFTSKYIYLGVFVLILMSPFIIIKYRSSET